MKKTFFCLIIFFVLVFGCVEETVVEKQKVFVERVIDGDTVKIENNESVRLIGIDSTEKGEPCFEEAKQKLVSLVEGKNVLLEKDVEERDKYGRLLGYVFLEDLFVNREMVETGNAYAFEYPPSTKYSEILERAQKSAKEQKNGCLWENT